MRGVQIWVQDFVFRPETTLQALFLNIQIFCAEIVHYFRVPRSIYNQEISVSNLPILAQTIHCNLKSQRLSTSTEVRFENLAFQPAFCSSFDRIEFLSFSQYNICYDYSVAMSPF